MKKLRLKWLWKREKGSMGLIEWRLEDNSYWYRIGGEYTGVWISKVDWIPIICFPHKIHLRKPIWRVLFKFSELPYIVDVPTLKEAMSIGECYHRTWLQQGINVSIGIGR